MPESEGNFFFLVEVIIEKTKKCFHEKKKKEIFSFDFYWILFYNLNFMWTSDPLHKKKKKKFL